MSAYVVKFTLTSAKMQDDSIIQAFHTVRIILYIGCSGPVVGLLTVSY